MLAITYATHYVLSFVPLAKSFIYLFLKRYFFPFSGKKVHEPKTENCTIMHMNEGNKLSWCGEFSH